MASVVKYTTSKGETRYMVRYRKPDGSQTKRRGFMRKVDAANWAAEHVTIAKAENRYVDPHAGKVTLGELHKRWLATKTPLWKESNRAREEKIWRLRYEDDWAGVRVGDLTCPWIQEWISGLAERYSAGYVVNVYSTMAALCRLAKHDRLIVEDPCEGVELPRVPARKERRVYLTIAELFAFAGEAANSRFLGDERRALVITLGLTGLRWGEATGLRVGDVDFDRSMLHVRHNTVWLDRGMVDTTPKSGEARDVVMPRVVSDALRPLCDGREDPDLRVFRDVRGGPLRRQSISGSRHNGGWWVATLQRLGWPRSKWPTPHDMRHTAASLAVHAGANVKALQRMLGHQTASMTLDVYADLFDSDLYDVARLLDAAVRSEVGDDRDACPKCAQKSEER